VQSTIQTVLLTRDPGLEAEVASFAEDLQDEVRLVVHVEEDDRRAIARAQERRVDLLLVELGEDVASVARLSAELQGADHPPVIVAVYRAQEFDGDEQLSTRFVELIRAGVRDFLSRPLSTSELRGLLRREFAGDDAPSPSNIGRVVSFVGSKGGVGKSTISVNTAVALARSGSVLIVDASLQHGVASDLLDIQPESTLADAAREVDRLDASLLASLAGHHTSGVHVLAAPSNAIEAAGVGESVLARVVSVARRAYDYVVIDTFPLLDSVTLAILDMSDMTFVVLNDSLPTVTGSAGLLEVLDRLGVDRARSRVVLNRTHPGRGLSPVDVATRLDRDIDHVVPYSSGVLQAANTGKPPAAGLGRLGRWGRALNGVARDAAEGKAAGRIARVDSNDGDAVLARAQEPEPIP
jgi:pilus assembly protein CpaE